MTVAQIMQAIGCSEAQARVLIAHVGQGTWATTERTIKHCVTCGKRQWHDGGQCSVCKQ